MRSIAPILFQGRQIVGRMPLFQPALRQANREDRKTMTRRVIKPIPASACISIEDFADDPEYYVGCGWCPYGKPGDVRVMCEPLVKGSDGFAYYRDAYPGSDEPAIVISLITGKPIKWRWENDFLTSVHMPTEAGRFVAEYSGIRAEKLQDITPEDAEAEGFAKLTKDGGRVWKYGIPDSDGLPGDDDHGWHWSDWRISPVDAFERLWDSINAKRGFPWASNPWVWAITFRRDQ